MKLLLPDVDYSNQIQFEDGKIISIECESLKYFKNLVSSIKRSDGENIKFLEQDNLLDCKKDVLTIIDYYSLEQYEKNILTKLYKSLDKIYGQDEIVQKSIYNIAKEIDNIKNEVVDDYNIEFEINVPMQLSEYVKFVSMKPKDGFSEDCFNGIINLITLASSLKLYKIIVFINPKSFFNEAELLEIVKCINYNGQKAVFIDNHYANINLINEKKLLIDEDFYDTIINN